MFRAIIFCVMLLCLCGVATATDVSGPVSGTWTLSGSPYNVLGEIKVPANQTLLIQSGVQVIFQGYFKFIIDSNATLQACGIEGDSVFFTCANPILRWHGLRFENASNSSLLAYCCVTYSLATFGISDNDGGAIYIVDCSPTIHDCHIDTCIAVDAADHAKGGGIFCGPYTHSIISNNDITRCSGFEGGAIFCCANSYPLIIDNLIENCRAEYAGGAIVSMCSDATIIHNVIKGNFGNRIGGGIICNYSNASIINNIIAGNFTNGDGGAILCNNSVGSAPTITNNTIVGNSAANVGGIYMGNCPISIITNCILWDNAPTQIAPGASFVTYCDIQGGYAGASNINSNPLFVSDPEGNYFLSQLAAGQTQQSPCVDAGCPATPLINGTTRTDGYPDQGIVDMGFHYAVFGGFLPPTNFSLLSPHDGIASTESRPVFDWENSNDPDGGNVNYTMMYDTVQTFTTAVTISNIAQSSWSPNYDFVPNTYWWKVIAFDDEGDSTQSLQIWNYTVLDPPPIVLNLTPLGQPIIIPMDGGRFNFTIELRNTTFSPQVFDFWGEICLPDFGSVQTLTHTDLTLPGNTSTNRLITQEVPAFAPAGTYIYYAYIGEYPWVISDADSFTFVKAGLNFNDALGVAKDWLCTSEPGANNLSLSNAIPGSYSLNCAFPNPFNPTTTIRFDLPEAGRVTLEVFDINGRNVRAYNNTPLQAGRHEILFDGSGLPSGIYVARLTAGDFSQEQKLVLLK